MLGKGEPRLRTRARGLLSAFAVPLLAALIAAVLPGGSAAAATDPTGPAMTVASQPLPSSDPVAAGRPARLLQPDLLLVSADPVPARVLRAVRRLPGVVAAIAVDAGRIRVNGVFVNVLGVRPAAFRPFAARPTAMSDSLWRNVSDGEIAVAYTMGRHDRLRPGAQVRVTGTRTMRLPVAGFGTVGIGGVDAVVSGRVAGLLGLPVGNAVVISAPHARLARLMAAIRGFAPRRTAVAALVTQVVLGRTVVTSDAAGNPGVVGQGLTAVQTARFLAAARSRLGMPYVWGAAGPTSFDCSGLVQWSMAQAGIVMPRVAADQARTGPSVPLSQLQPGDLLFYHTDPTAPGYISHVAIYLGNGLMIQAPEPGLNVEIVSAYFGPGFAGAVRVYPKVAAAVAANPAG